MTERRLRQIVREEVRNLREGYVAVVYTPNGQTRYLVDMDTAVRDVDDAKVHRTEDLALRLGSMYTGMRPEHVHDVIEV